jgi:hypothetical protein
MSDVFNVNADFGRLQGTAEQTASTFNQPGTHPIFSAIHSFVLAHRYGNESPWTYMNNPGLRAMDTREAAFEGLQKVGATVKRWRAGSTAPTVPSPTPQPAAQPIPKVVPLAQHMAQAGGKPPTYSQPMTPPGTAL